MMNQSSNKTIEAVVEIESFTAPPPWLILQELDSSYVRLHASISEEEIGSVMLRSCFGYSEPEFAGTASDTLETFVSDENFVLAGGLLFRENNEIKVVPNCCCGLEDWHQWLDVPNGICSIWTGHSPESLIEINDGKIKIWQDSERKEEKDSIEFTLDEMIEHLNRVEKDLKDFLFRLGEWTKNITPELEQRVVNHFAKNMNIKL